MRREFAGKQADIFFEDIPQAVCKECGAVAIHVEMVRVIFLDGSQPGTYSPSGWSSCPEGCCLFCPDEMTDTNDSVMLLDYLSELTDGRDN
jgi:hypothetical protein